MADSQTEVRLRIKPAQAGEAKSVAQGLDGVELVTTEDKNQFFRR